MADNTPIEWADATVNAINGCSVLSPGCKYCYAMKLAGTRLKHHPSRAALTVDTKAGPVWTGEVRLHEPALFQPLRWRRSRTIFWNAHGDTFHEAVPDEWIDRMFAAMALTPRHKHLVLTKRSSRMRAYFTARSSGHAVWRAMEGLAQNQQQAHIRDSWYGGPVGKWPLPNVWLGVSAEDQARADERIPDLLATPAAGRFLSCEPLLGPIDLTSITLPTCTQKFDALVGMGWGLQSERYGGGRLHHGATKSPYGKIDGIIVGGESGPDARPMRAAWARSLRDQCAVAGVDFHFKQWGEFRPTSDCNGPYMMRVGKRSAGRDLDGVIHDALPWRRAA